MRSWGPGMALDILKVGAQMGALPELEGVYGGPYGKGHGNNLYCGYLILAAHGFKHFCFLNHEARSPVWIRHDQT